MTFTTCPELEILLREITNEIIDSGDNKNIKKVYENCLEEYPILKNYSLIIGTNDTKNDYFHKTITNNLNEKSFYDYNTKQDICINHPFMDYTNILFLSKNHLKNNLPTFDYTVFVDSNAINFFHKFYMSPKENKNTYIDFIIKNKVDMNYLPYILEDYINKHHKNPQFKRTWDKIKSFEIVNNFDKEYYTLTGKIKFDQKLLESEGYNSVRNFIEDKKFYFANFFERKNAKEIILPNKSLYYSGKKVIDFNGYFSQYWLIYGYVLNILIEKHSKNSTEDKIHNILKNMCSNGQELKHILYFAYLYFERDFELELNKFFNFDFVTQSYDEVLEKARNITWDIFLYITTQNFLTKPLKRVGDIEFKADIGIPLFLTEDKKLYNSFIKHYSLQIVIVDETSDLRPFNGLSTKMQLDYSFMDMLISFHSKYINEHIRKKIIFKKFKKTSNVYAIRLLFKERMERKFKKFWLLK